MEARKIAEKNNFLTSCNENANGCPSKFFQSSILSPSTLGEYCCTIYASKRPQSIQQKTPAKKDHLACFRRLKIAFSTKASDAPILSMRASTSASASIMLAAALGSAPIDLMCRLSPHQSKAALRSSYLSRRSFFMATVSAERLESTLSLASLFCDMAQVPLQISIYSVLIHAVCRISNFLNCRIFFPAVYYPE